MISLEKIRLFTVSSKTLTFPACASLGRRRSISFDVCAEHRQSSRLKEGNVDAAIERFEAAIKLNPEDARGHYDLAKALLQKGQKEAAQTEYQKAKQLDPRLKPIQ